ncbi:MAG: glycosyl transferase 2 family protein [Alphaproteobacteria bacterium]|nr:glycosyl transferase 2 family protein [Alphaproteobacteria bacterium]|tara:strand:- start:14633 stop:15487 length:855 start_codon:yes stop_codon:yes gene_type:complete
MAIRYSSLHRPQKLPITVIITTKNEEHNIARCLKSLSDFEHIIVVDSNSDDQTQQIAHHHSATVIPFEWNGQYPKKRQYCLDHFAQHIHHDWVFFIDADEVMTPKLVSALRTIGQSEQAANIAGYFIRGQYIWKNKPLNFGLKNNKIALFNRHEMAFPAVNDLPASAFMGEIEGHYQPVLKEPFTTRRIGKLRPPLWHYACENINKWRERHQRYAAWEDYMDKHQAWPQEDNRMRARLKNLFKSMPAPIKAITAFTHCYILCLGFLDGIAGLQFAWLRGSYYWR